MAEPQCRSAAPDVCLTRALGYAPLRINSRLQRCLTWPGKTAPRLRSGQPHPLASPRPGELREQRSFSHIYGCVPVGGATTPPCGMSPYEDPIPALKREAVTRLAEVLRYGNGDDLGVRLGTDRFRIADLRRGRLARFSLEALLRFLARAGMRVELHVTRAPRPQRRAISRSAEPHAHGGSAETARGLERKPRQYCRAFRQYCTGRAEDLGRRVYPPTRAAILANPAAFARQLMLSTGYVRRIRLGTPPARTP